MALDRQFDQWHANEAADVVRVALDRQAAVGRHDALLADPPTLDGVFADELAMSHGDDQMDFLT